MLACPYCYNRFAAREIAFRCTGLPGPDGQTCGVERDENLVRWLGNVTPLPPAFAADGRKGAAKCPKCHNETAYHICPVCHSRLPVHFGMVDSRLIAMIGAKQSGKTVFMTVLIHELKHRVGRNLDAAIMGSDEETRKSFERDYDDRLYQQHALPETTMPLAAPSTRQPLVFRMTMRRKRLFSQRCEQQTILSFFDTAGEDLSSEESVELNVRYLSSAHAIILLLDPLQMAGARSQALENTILPVAGASSDRPFNVLSRVTDLLRSSLTSHPSQRIQTPIAVAFSKLDSLAHTFPRDSPLTRRPEPRPEFDTQDSLAVHHQVQALLDDWDGPQIDQLMRHHYARYRYFGISALGDLPLDAATVSQIRPHRVHDPFLWLLSEFGTIPATRG
jgi:GTPase SAR1 family protein